MADHPEAKITATVGRSRRLSPIWAIPIVTALIAGFLVWHTYSQRGPTITITFRSAEGLTAGQSQLRYRDVVMGTVQDITLSNDLDHVTMTVRTTRAAEPLLTSNARFWVVKPRLFAGSISGLDTLLSGSYIQIAPAAPGGAVERRFTGLEDPPLLTAQEPGRTFLLRADRIGSISLGSPIFYRDLDVGQVMGWDLEDMAQSVTIHAFIRAPFDRYVRQGSRFWNASGISLRMGSDGIQLQLESLRALLLGGIAFETPDIARHGREVPQDEAFRLYANQEAANNAALTRRVPVVSYFTDSISGLAPGAPVTFQGVRIGEVLGYDLTYDAATEQLRVPVRYEIEPERVAGSINAQGRSAIENARLLVRQGMRARLMSANLITGQQQIALEMIENPAPAEITMQGDVIVMPSVPGQFASIMDGVNRVLAGIESMPWGDIGRNVDNTVSGVNELIRGPELRESLAALRGTLTAAEETMRRLDTSLQPALRSLPQIMTNLNATVAQANRLILSASRGYGDEFRFHRDLDRMLEQITVAARSLRSLVDQLNRNPELLIRGRSTQGSDRMMFRRRDAASIAALALLAACRSTEPVLYALQPVPGTPRRGGPRNVAVREVSLARYLDRVQIVRSVAEYRLAVSGNDWWGENLDTMMTRLLVENLAQRLPSSNVFATGGAISVTPEATVEVNLQRLGQTGPESLAMTAQIAVTMREPRRREVARTEALTAPVASAEMEAFVAAASAAAGQLADAVAAILTA